jgi:hypothetical protein
MKNNTLIFVSLALCFITLGLIYFERKGYFDPREEVIKTDTVFTTKTDTLWKDTTIVEKEIVPKYIVKKKVDTMYTKEGDTLNLITEAKRFDKRLISNKDTADLQIYTTGIETSLDSLKMRLKTHTDVITNTVEVTKYIQKKKTFWDRWHVGLQGGYGYTFKTKDLQPYVGVGISFDL